MPARIKCFWITRAGGYAQSCGDEVHAIDRIMKCYRQRIECRAEYDGGLGDGELFGGVEPPDGDRWQWVWWHS